MKQWKQIMIAGLFVFLLSACSDPISTPEEVFAEFKGHWEKGNYDQMYEMISEEAKNSLTKEEFIELLNHTYETVEADNVSIELMNEEESEEVQAESDVKSELSFKKDMEMITGPLSFEGQVTLILEGEEEQAWKVSFTPSMILPALDFGDAVKVEILPTVRGEIIDRNGNELAVNGTAYEIGIVPGRMEGNEERTIQEISEKLEMSEERIQNLLGQSWVGPETFVPVVKVPKSEKEFVDYLYENVDGATYREVAAREYPLGEAAAHLIGYIEPITAEELEQLSEEGYTSNSVLGKTGLERLLEERLRGETGVVIYTVNEDGERKVEVAKKEPLHGETFQLTIDSTIQKSIASEYEQSEKAGTSVALHPKTGEVLSLVSSPMYDPNQFTLGNSSQYYSEEADEKRPLMNRFTQTFIPGSVIKPITAAIALNNDWDPDVKVESSNDGWRKDESWGEYSVRRVPNPLQSLNLTEAMQYSDNIYFAKMVDEIGSEALEEGFNRFGFTEEIPFPYGMTASTFARESIQEGIQLADTGYGQGELLTNPLHLSLLYTAFVNEGAIPKPLLFLDEEQALWKEDLVSAEHAAIIEETLASVIEKGTAQNAKIDQLPLIGKTGTAELKVSQTDEGGEEIGWFVAMNKEEPELLVLMMMEGASSGVVVPKVRNVIEQYFSR